MENGKLSDQLIRFIAEVNGSRTDNGRQLSVLDLRLECRIQRLTEFSEWSTEDLDLVEKEAVCYGDETALTKVLSGEAMHTAVTADSYVPSPSLFAWT